MTRAWDKEKKCEALTGIEPYDLGHVHSVLSGTLVFSFSHVRVMLINLPFKTMYKLMISPNLFLRFVGDNLCQEV